MAVGSRTAPRLILLFTATLAFGCVDLQKPLAVKECAATNSCSDDPSKQPKPDAAADAAPDSPLGDAPSDRADVPIPDVPADHGDASADTRDVSGGDGREAGGADVLDGADAEPDAAPDLPRRDGPDAGADVRPDLPPDRPPDLPPDVPPDRPPDQRPDVGPDVRPDVSPDLPPDIPPDTSTLLTGLLAYYKCENASGTSLPDSSGKGNNGTLSASGFSFPTGKVGKALSLAKASQGSVTLPAAMFVNATDFTFAAWINVTSSANWARVLDVGINAKLANNTSTGTKYLNLVPKDEGTNLLFSITTDGYGSEKKLTGATPAVATWKHVAVVLGASGGLYLDGTLVVNASAVTLRPRDLGTIDYAFLGKSQFSADPYFDGMLDEVRVYGRALDAAEVKALSQFAGP